MDPLVLGDHPLPVATLVALARDGGRVVLDDEVRARIARSAAHADAAAVTGAAYGRTTGVGANRNVAADDGDGRHGLRLVRSHTAGAGPDAGELVARATMLVRCHQLSRPGSGIPVDTLDALVAATNDGRAPVVRSLGGIGTGDITVLGELALCLLGERPWRDGTTHRYLEKIGANAALALMSSSAPTLAAAAIGLVQLEQLARASLAVTALGAVAVRANPQQWSPVAASTRPSPGVEQVTDELRRVLDGTTWTPARTQDPFGWRAAPFVLGPLLDVLREAFDEATGCIDAGAENPRFTADGVWHHGAFHLTSLALRLDTVRLAATQWFTTSLGRLVKLHDPAYTNQQRFLAHGPAGSSGTMVLEYTAASALETVRHLAAPVTADTTSISVGTEDHASFASRAAIALRDLVAAARTVLACELVAAVRAVRHTDADLGEGVRDLLARCDALPTDTGDRPLVDDLDVAAALLDEL